MKIYKPDQGRLARMFAFWSLVLLLLFGCNFLHGQLVSFDSLAGAISGVRIPIVAVDLSLAFLIAGAIFLGGLLFLHGWLQKPKTADLLIETEAELYKVTWPTPQEVVNSSLVVAFCVVLLGLFLAGADWFLARVMKGLLFGTF